MKVKSPAKLNLHLEVIKKRTDGFHELRTVYHIKIIGVEFEFNYHNKKIVIFESPLHKKIMSVEADKK